MPLTHRERFTSLRQDLDDLLSRLTDGKASPDEAAEWAARTFEASMPNGHEFDADPRLWETLGDLMELGPFGAVATRKDFERLLKRFRTPEPKRLRRKGSGGR